MDSLGTQTFCLIKFEHYKRRKGLGARVIHSPPEILEGRPSPPAGSLFQQCWSTPPSFQEWDVGDVPIQAGDDLALPLCIQVTLVLYNRYRCAPVKALLVIDALTDAGLLRGCLLRPAYQSSMHPWAKGGGTRTSLCSVFFTAYPKALGYEVERLWTDTTSPVPSEKQKFVSSNFPHISDRGMYMGFQRNGEWIEPLVNALHDETKLITGENQRFAHELKMRKRHRALLTGGTSTNGTEEDDDHHTSRHRFDDDDDDDDWIDSGDERNFNDEIPPYLPQGADYSGRPGYRCQMCNRRSEFVGHRRGFDYCDRICGGCCDLEQITDEEVKVWCAKLSETGTFDPHLPFVRWYLKDHTLPPVSAPPATSRKTKKQKLNK